MGIVGPQKRKKPATPIKSGPLGSKTPSARTPMPPAEVKPVLEESTVSSFTVDTEKTTIMPSVTKLLNRRSLGLGPAASSHAHPTPSRDSTIALSTSPPLERAEIADPSSPPVSHSDAEATRIAERVDPAPPVPILTAEGPALNLSLVRSPADSPLLSASVAGETVKSNGRGDFQILQISDLKKAETPQLWIMALALKYGAKACFGTKMVRSKRTESIRNSNSLFSLPSPPRWDPPGGF